MKKILIFSSLCLTVLVIVGSISLFPLSALANPIVTFINANGNPGASVDLATCTGGSCSGSNCGTQIYVSSVLVTTTCGGSAPMITLVPNAEATFPPSTNGTDVWFVVNPPTNTADLIGVMTPLNSDWIYDSTINQYVLSNSAFTFPYASGIYNAQVCMVEPGAEANSLKCSCSAPFNFNLCEQPISNAGQNQTVHTGNLVTLDGSGSSDPSGLALTYSWSFASVPAAYITLLNPTSVHPTFIAYEPGNYVVQLVVTNSAGVQSSVSTVTISTTNTPPVASAGPDQSVSLIGTTIQLDGSQSYDPDGDPTWYLWSFVSIPAGSKAKLSNPAIVNPTFVADVHGTYVVQLVVSDLWSQSAPAQVTISSLNIKPVANAGTNQSAVLGDTVNLSGSGSYDADGDPITYQWSFTSVPAGSSATILSPISVSTTFVPDLAGSYVVQLIVNDGYVNSDPSTVQVQVISIKTEAIDAARNLETAIASLNPAMFKNRNMPNALINKLNAVIANIGDGNYSGALDQLQNDILGKTDGCATAGAPDKNDWVINCQGQNQIYPGVLNIIKLVQNLK